MTKTIAPALALGLLIVPGTSLANDRIELNDENRNRAHAEEIRDVTFDHRDDTHVYFRTPDGQRIRAPLNSVVGTIDLNGDRRISQAEATAAQRMLAR